MIFSCLFYKYYNQKQKKQLKQIKEISFDKIWTIENSSNNIFKEESNEKIPEKKDINSKLKQIHIQTSEIHIQASLV
jgi:hypothetical protein